MDEMKSLLETLSVEMADSMEIQVRKISPATYIGKGKLDEIERRVKDSGAQAVIIDTELSPNQLRNLEKKLGKETLDRPGVIIEIFSRHARTKEAKTQVELARLQYLMPRLAHFWSHFERQRGGIGLRGGPGEKQIEVDRRLLGKRMALLRQRLQAIEKERRVQRAGRSAVLKVALVGYTNAGKSTLLNALTRGGALAQDKLFATLDSTVRALDPDSRPPIVAIDTVGFISNIPTFLIASFRSTLEELETADLLLHVVDASNPRAKDQVRVSEQVLADLNLAEKPRITFLNKLDSVGGPGARNLARLVAPGALKGSALNPEDVSGLRKAIMDHFRKSLEVWEVVIPYSESRLESGVRDVAYVDQVRYVQKGTFFRIRINGAWARRLGLERFRMVRENGGSV